MDSEHNADRSRGTADASGGDESERLRPLPSPIELSNPKDTQKYFKVSLEQARKEVARLTMESSRRSGNALRQLDGFETASGAHGSATAARRPGSRPDFDMAIDELERSRTISRLCEAEKNVVIERDRYSRLLARHTGLTEERAADAKRIETLQGAVTEYEKLNKALQAQLEQQGTTLERAAEAIRTARAEFHSYLKSNNLVPFPGNRIQGPAGEAATSGIAADAESLQQELSASRSRLSMAIAESTAVLREFDRRIGSPAKADGDIMEATLPM